MPSAPNGARRYWQRIRIGPLLITLENRDPLEAVESNPNRSSGWRRRQRCIDTEDTVWCEIRPDRRVLINRAHWQTMRIKLEKLDLRRFLRRGEICSGVIFVAPALSDCRTNCTGVLPVEGGRNSLGNRGGHRTRNKHSSPCCALQHHPVRTA